LAFVPFCSQVGLAVFGLHTTQSSLLQQCMASKYYRCIETQLFLVFNPIL